MSRKPSKKLNLDSRKAADIEDRIVELSQSYDTGWHMNKERPDIGAALAHVFAGQMEENIGRVNEILDRYHTEFVNMLDLSLLPARPASGLILLSLIADTIPGTGVAKGTKFLTNTEPPYVFEADHSLYVTAAEILSVFMTDVEEGTIKYLSDENGMIAPFTLYGPCDDYPVNKAIFYHPFLFDAQGDDLFVKIAGNREFIRQIEDGKYVFTYETGAGEKEMDEVELLPDGETFRLVMGDTPVKNDNLRDANGELLEFDEGDEDLLSQQRMYAMMLSAKGPVEASAEVSSVGFSASGKPMPPESVTNGSNDLEVNKFVPFTDTLALYAECFIGADRCFSKAGAQITMTFSLSFLENRVSLTQEEIDDSLKIIKRRPNVVRSEAYTDCYVDEIAVEYFNGVGWKRLELEGAGMQLFDSTLEGKIEITFICPEDWEKFPVGAYDGRSIRLQITKSDNCYLRPAVHHYPVVRDMLFSYSYHHRFEPATKVELIMGAKRMDISTAEYSGEPYVLFSVSEYNEDALYIGLSERIASGPASILFELEEGNRYNGLDVNFEYSSIDGYKQMKVLDYTDGFTKTGIVAFVPPPEWSMKEQEGLMLYWIRVVRAKGKAANETAGSLPRIRDIALNALSVSNIETRPEESVYIEEVVPNMRFTLGATGVLDADVWVNETGRYTQEQMASWQAADPDNVRIEKDPRGIITAIYVRWKEVDHFETAEDKRVYQLDRLQNELIFGDGVHTWMPGVVDDAAVRFTVRCCNGAVGNVPEYSITEARDFLMYVGSVANPIKAYGGSDIESLDNALERGASILSSRYRLITMDDYIRAIRAYSDTIDACVGIAGQTVDGDYDEASMTFVLLMKEFMEGSYAFHRIVGGLKRFLLGQSEITVVPEKLHIIEPVFVSISVSVWVNVVELDDSFEIQNILRECLDEYLSPLGHDTGTGWRIGTLPKKPQILMRLGILKSRTIIRKSVMIASYSDGKGTHEVDLDDLKVTPFMIPRSGDHKVHIMY